LTEVLFGYMLISKVLLMIETKTKKKKKN
jgi:hypothetical protein